MSNFLSISKWTVSKYNTLHLEKVYGDSIKMKTLASSRLEEHSAAQREITPNNS